MVGGSCISGWVYLVIACVAVTASNTCLAQITNDEGTWLALFSQGDVGESQFKWWFDGHARFLDDAGGFNQSIVRPGFGYSLGDRGAVWAGYGWIRTSPLTGAGFDEHRVWQQYTWSKKHDAITLALRSRLEQRFLDTGDDTGWRFRQLVRLQHALPASRHLSLVGWDEVFIHLNDTDWGAEAGFNQNRVFVGLGWTPSPKSNWRTEVGYLNQTIHRPTADDRSHHVISINFYVRP